jgi:glucose/arabinose dehydrogenase
MKSLHVIFFLIAFLVFTSDAISQRGVPPRKKFRSTYVAKYAQHLDFLPPMVKLLNVPDGWEVSIAASGLGRIRMMQLTPEGGMYVTRRDGADVLYLKDANGDNVFDDVKTVEFFFRNVHGLALKDGYLYLVNNEELRRYRIKENGLLSDREILINDLPSGGQHPNRTIGFGPDGMLYITIGTLCNDCKENDPEVAALLQVDPKTWKRTIYATGLRNMIGFDFHPQTKEMWGADNGTDGKGNRWPPEEINRIVKGGNYGYPFAYGKREIDHSRDDPPGDTKEKWVQSTEP